MTVRHRNGAYPIVFADHEDVLAELPTDSVIVTDENLALAYNEALARFNRKLILPPGEESKSFATYQTVLQWLAEMGVKRSEQIVAFGGGVIGDLVGFVAATYMRGIGFVQIPTSLLAMVDSSIGGKVGIDLPQGKNLVGAFKPPSAVYICLDLISSLPDRQFVNGMGEVLKYGFIMDKDLAKELHHSPVTATDSRLKKIVERCLRHKASVVERDEFETSGLRAILNFGHTVGHAVEKVLEYRDLLHGEAISAGMVVEAAVREKVGLAPIGTLASVEETLLAHKLPVKIPKGLNLDQVLQAMLLDKKRTTEGIAMSLLTGLGSCKLITSVDSDMILTSLHEYAQT
jgi:3-dehydroquinate synthase